MAGKLQGNFAQSNVPTVGEAMRGAFQDFNRARQNLIANEIANEDRLLKEKSLLAANADREARLKLLQASGQREQETYDLANQVREGTRNVMLDPNLGATGPTADEMQSIEAKYAQVNSPENLARHGLMTNEFGETVRKSDQFGGALTQEQVGAITSPDVEKLNEGLGTYFGRDGSGTISSVLGSQNEVRQRVLNDLMKVPGMDYEKASLLAAGKAQELKPVLSAEQAKEMKKAKLEEMKLLLGKGGAGSTVNINTGSTGTGYGADKVVGSSAIDPKIIDYVIDRDKTGSNLTGKIAEWFGGDKMATQSALTKVATGIKMEAAKRGLRVDDYGVANVLPMLINSEETNIWRDATLKPGSMEDLVDKGIDYIVSQGQSIKGQRTTDKGTSGTSSEEQLLRINALEDLRKYNAMVDAQSSPNTVSRGDDAFFNLLNEEKKQKDQKDSSSNANKSKGSSGYFTAKELMDRETADAQFIIDAANGVETSTVTPSKIKSIDKQIEDLGKIDSVSKYDQKEALSNKKSLLQLADRLRVTVNKGGLQKMTPENKQLWKNLGKAIHKGIINTSELPKNVLTAYQNYVSRWGDILTSDRDRLLQKEREATAHDTLFNINPISPNK